MLVTGHFKELFSNVSVFFPICEPRALVAYSKAGGGLRRGGRHPFLSFFLTFTYRETQPVSPLEIPLWPSYSFRFFNRKHLNLLKFLNCNKKKKLPGGEQNLLVAFLELQEGILLARRPLPAPRPCTTYYPR